MNVHTIQRPQATQPTGTPFFYCRNLDSYYGDSYIVQKVSFSLNKGEILALLGRNGAGKTSTLRSIARASTPELHGGEVVLDGVKLHGKPNYFAAQAGVQLVQEDRRIIPGMTVEQNLQLAIINGKKGWPFERIYELFPRLAERRKQEGVTMSGGEQQMLAIGRALMTRPRLLMLDEPSQGIMPKLVDEIFRAVKTIRDTGMTVLIVEQRMAECLEIADRAYILQTGKILMQGTAAEIGDNPDVRKAYLGL